MGNSILSSIYRRGTTIFVILVLLILPLMIYVSQDYGITYDEQDQQRYGLEVYHHFATNGENQTYLVPYYGGLFELLAVVAQKLDPHAWVFHVRHAMNAVVGWAAILFVGLLAKRLFGTWTGILAVILMLLSPRFFGHSMNDSKDVPFASAFIAGLYALSFLRSRYPYYTGLGLVGIIVAIAATLNVRVGGLLLIPYAAVVLLAIMLKDWRNLTVPRVASTIVMAAFAGLVALVLGTQFWPWAQAFPFTRPYIALQSLERFPWCNDMLFGGGMINACYSLPVTYLPVWFAITTPIAVIVGCVFAVLSIRSNKEGMFILAIWMAAAFPIAYIIVKGSVVYDGLRHVLFAYPPLVVLAAAGWSRALWYWKRRWPDLRRRAVLPLVLVVLLFEPARFMIVNHPHEVVFFNPLIGGVRGANGNFELDYWGGCVKQGLEWVQAHAKRNGRPVTYFTNPVQFAALYSPIFPQMKAAGVDRADYDVVFLRGLADFTRNWNHALYLGQKLQIVHKLEVDGVPICLIMRPRQ